MPKTMYELLNENMNAQDEADANQIDVIQDIMTESLDIDVEGGLF